MAETIRGISVQIGADTTALSKALSDVNSRSRDIQKELRQVEQLLKFDPGNTELLAQKQTLLQNALTNTTSKLDQLRSVQEQVNKQFANNEISDGQFRAFQREIAKAEAEIRKFDNSLNSIDAGSSLSRVENDIEDIEDAAEKAERSIKRLGPAFSDAAKGAAALGAAASAALGGLVTGMEDYNRSMARLNASAWNEGFDPAVMEQQVQKIAALTGETDSAVETLNNLMATNLSESQLVEAIDAINGAAIKFSDTLKTEGIADGLQETLATGAAIGPFAELLERSGVDLDKFNQGLANAAKTGQETNFVLQQLNDLGLASTYETYKQMNPELVANQEAQQKLQAALAELSITLMPLVTTVMTFVTSIAEWVNKNVELVQSFDTVGEGLSVLLGTLMEQGKQIIGNIITGIVEGMPGFIAALQELIPKVVETLAEVLPVINTVGADIMISIIEGIVSILPEVLTTAVSVITSMVDTWAKRLPEVIDSGIQILESLIEGILEILPDLAKTAVELITLVAETVLENLPTVIEAGIEILNSLIEGILEILPSLLETALMLIENLVDTLMSNLPKIIEMGMKLLESLIDGILKILPDLIQTALKLVITIIEKIVENLPKIIEMGVELLGSLIEGIVKTIPKLISMLVTELIPAIFETISSINLFDIGGDIIAGLKNGISNKAKELYAEVEKIANNVAQAITDFFGIHSPARLTTEYGGNISEGLAKGIKEKSGEAAKEAKEAAKKVDKSFKDSLSTAQYNFKIGNVDDSGYIKSLNKIKTQYAKTTEQIQKVSLEIKKANEQAAKSAEKAAKESFDASKKYIDARVSTGKASLQQEISMWEKVQAKYKKGSEQQIAAEKEIYKLKQELTKSNFENSKAYIEKQTAANEFSLVEQLKAWERVQSKYKAGSEQAKAAEEEIGRLRVEIYNELTQASEDYLAKTKEINANVAAEELRLNQVYEQAVQQRANSISGFAGIFDEVVKETEVSGQQLIENLKSQVLYLHEWSDDLQKLAIRGLDAGLLEELQQLGPKAAPEIAALNTLTDAQLNEYTSLWKAKTAESRSVALRELSGLREDTNKQIEQLHTDAAKQLEAVKNEFNKKISEIRYGATDQFNAMKADLPEIGKQAMKGLLNGMSSMQGEVTAKAKTIADSIRKTMEKALDIHSPSRETEWIGEMAGQGLAQGLEGMISSVKAQAKNLSQAVLPSVENVPVGAVAGSGMVNNNYHMQGLFNGANISIRNDDDIRKLTQEIGSLANGASRGWGGATR
ncbi:hypothetical protein [Paenibacillus illinoisensis]|uniref:hypothetical protein n=1 Tax=Paenibacillus illinoisensis TaxID=59845 RepID=UPI00203D838B|nr:hypothetical protein [Paenibacillus illinoisensis]MCM3208488.1 hypothetical protein [Paenibacillus illinoisensis]